ncbi:MAG: bifunctional riboflavin kinase/FAD synthetase [Candidatus Aminicenantes bacterium]|nr:MAG: bifunctional riboflavin kinase/FAD synthetase [Candidatus Aminicenantes bacterium]
MQGIKSLKDIPSPPDNCAVAIGNFDGVHLGHQKIVRVLIEDAKKSNLFPLLLTFHPHPAKILAKRKIELLQTIEQRLDEIKKSGVQMTIVLSFDQNLSQITAEEFIRTIIVQKLKAKKVIVGDNFRFGKDRDGDVVKLREWASHCGFSVQSIPPVTIQGSVVSSSLIRKLLHLGEIEKANLFLGRPYEIEGTVIRGKSRGKRLGFPTANIHPSNDISPPGVFISKVRIGSRAYPSITHVGSKPTFNEKDIMIESYVIDYNKSLYKKKLRVFFLKKIREEKKFETSEALSLRIKEDLEITQAFFQKQNSPS